MWEVFMTDFNFLKLITGRCLCLFWQLGTVYSETGLFYCLFFQHFFYLLIYKNLFLLISFKFLKGKKIEWVLIIVVFDIPELPSKWKDFLSVSSSFPEKTLGDQQPTFLETTNLCKLKPLVLLFSCFGIEGLLKRARGLDGMLMLIFSGVQ